MTRRPRVAILFGGCSEEHDVSVKSAMEVAASIDIRKHEPIYVGITKRGVWMMCDRAHPAWDDGTGGRAVISPDRATHGLLVGERGESRAVHIDAVFPVLHGRSGEDGAVQGLLELSGIPYVGCDIQTSAICMDKALAYVVAKNGGIDTPAFSVLDGADAAAPNELAYPVFVKPARSGSSFGVTRVDRADDLGAAIAAARVYDGKVLIEQAIFGSEVGCAVLGKGADLFVGEVDQITLRHGIFRIHQEAEPEQGSENAIVTVPADLPAEQREEIRATAKTIYVTLGCEGLARVDMFLQADGRIVLNEVNTMPGFTSYSRYPRMMAAAGLGRSELIDRLISLAMAR
jgi:D-alanine---(R)-lactate ligase